MSAYGPLFTAVPASPVPSFPPVGDVPIYIPGGAAAWPALTKWTFDVLAAHAEATGLVDDVCEGMTEQGPTIAPTRMALGKYFRELGEEAGEAGDGLAPPGSPEAEILAAGGATRLRFEWLASFRPVKRYLGLWDMLAAIPIMKADIMPASLWPAFTMLNPFMWVGPSRTITGLHVDFPDNWFTQIRGTKEFLLIPPQAVANLPFGTKFELGAYVAKLNISNLPAESPEALAAFAAITGAMYVRVNPGDCLYVPRMWYHAVVSTTPSISISTFGLRPLGDFVTVGLRILLRGWAHSTGLWKWDDCTCHQIGTPRPKATVFIKAGAVAVALGALALLVTRRA